MQDSKGFMWFGTTDGLNKYDGYTFTVYEHDPANPNSLSNNAVYAIAEDRSGTLWIGTWGGGLNRFDRETERWRHYQHDPSDAHSLSNSYVFSMLQDQSGVLWVGTWRGGLNRFDPETEQFTRHQYDPHDPHSLSSNNVLSIYEDQSGVLWIGTGGGGLNRFDRETERFARYQHDPTNPHSLSNDDVLSIYEDQAGVLWVGTAGGGLNEFDRKTGRWRHYQHAPSDPRSLTDNIVWPIYEDQTGALWVGTYSGGLERFDGEARQFTHYQHDPGDPHSLSSNRVRAIYEDQSGVLWMGTDGGGLSKAYLGKRDFVHYQHDPGDPNSLSSNDVFSIYEDRSGVLWIGTYGGGLSEFDREHGRWHHYQHDPHDPNSLSHDVVFSVLEDRSGVLWIGTGGGGLNRLDRETGRFTRFQHDPADPGSLSHDVVFSVYEDQAGLLWVGTFGGGLNRLDRETETFTRYQHDPADPNSLSDDRVLSVYQDRAGMLWIATADGLDSFDPQAERFAHYRHDPDDPSNLSDNYVLSLCEDQAGALWVGTNGGGLDRFDREKKTFTHYGEEQGLPDTVVGQEGRHLTKLPLYLGEFSSGPQYAGVARSELDFISPQHGLPIYGILEDEQGFLWVSTDRGLSRFDPRTETFRNYDVSDGLQGNEFYEGACHKSSRGELFFGGVNGFSAFYPERIEDNAYVPPIVLTALQQSGEDIDLDQAVEDAQHATLAWPNNFFEFEFAALSYAQPEKNQYAYMLEGLDKHWNYTGSRRFGRYTNLAGGVYTLRMKGSNNDGVWNEAGTSLTITVVPPFWATWWFRGIVIVALVGGVIGGYRLRVQTIEARSRELEDLVAERTREIEQRRQQLEALYRADEELYGHLRLNQVLQAFVDIAVDILQADKSAMMVWDEQRERLVLRVARGYRPETRAQMSFAPGEGLVGLVASTGELAIVEDTRTDSRVVRRIIEAEGIRASIHVPVRVAGRVFGVLNACYVRPHTFGEDEQRLFTALAQRAALAIENAQLYERAQELAVVEERSRLARDLHDSVTQTLFSISLLSETLPALWESDPDEGRHLLVEVQRLSRGALAEMRTLLLELRPAAVVEASLGDLLRQLGETVTGRTGVPVTVTVEGRCTPPTDVHMALYRIAQEALNNVVKHAQATQVVVSLRSVPPTSQEDARKVGGSVELCIKDDGCGFDPACLAPDSLGLDIMRERAQSVGARLEIESQPECGTRVTVVWQDDERPTAKQNQFVLRRPSFVVAEKGNHDGQDRPH